MEYTDQQLLRIIENITIQENGTLTSCSKESIRGNMKITLYQQLLRRIETITIQDDEILTSCSKEPIRGIMKYTHQQLLRRTEEHNDPREWQTHVLLKRIHPGNYEYIHISIWKHKDLQENGTLAVCSKVLIQMD